MKSNIDNLMEDLETAYLDTIEAHGERQAIGSVLAYLVKHDVSFISKKLNRDMLLTYSNNDISFILVEHLIIKVGHEKDVIELGKHPDVDICTSYEEAKNIIANYLIRYDKNTNKIAFGDVINIIKTIQIHENIKNYLVNSLVLDTFQ